MTPHLERYGSSLTAGAAAKARAIGPWLTTGVGDEGEVVDVGTGTGALAFRLSDACPRTRFVGIDADRRMLGEARRARNGRPNVELRRGFASEPHAHGAAVVVLCSVLHEVYSYRGDSVAAVAEALRASRDSLAPGGRIIIRDFVRPVDSRRPVVLSHRSEDIVPGHDFESFSKAFSRAIALHGVTRTAKSVHYRTDMGSAYEFIARKDFHEMWSRELMERYGFWDEPEAKALVSSAGFRILHVEVRRDPWVLRHGLLGKIRLLEPASGDPVPFPPRHVLLVGERI